MLRKVTENKVDNAKSLKKNSRTFVRVKKRSGGAWLRRPLTILHYLSITART